MSASRKVGVARQNFRRVHSFYNPLSKFLDPPLYILKPVIVHVHVSVSSYRMSFRRTSVSVVRFLVGAQTYLDRVLG